MYPGEKRIATVAEVEEMERQNPGDIFRGYMDGFENKPWPGPIANPSPGYRHGSVNGACDRLGVASTCHLAGA